ncbi:MAG: hypothetical protein GY953_30355, partial [bacterium]|nr:hypothetical protein [bacterium]
SFPDFSANGGPLELGFWRGIEMLEPDDGEPPPPPPPPGPGEEAVRGGIVVAAFEGGEPRRVEPFMFTAGIDNWWVQILTSPAPIARDDTFGIAPGATLNSPAPGVLENDTDPDGDAVTTVLVRPPEHGSGQLNPDGSFTYTPDAGFTGVDTFTYQAFDGVFTSQPATVTIVVGESAACTLSPMNATMLSFNVTARVTVDDQPVPGAQVEFFATGQDKKVGLTDHLGEATFEATATFEVLFLGNATVSTGAQGTVGEAQFQCEGEVQVIVDPGLLECLLKALCLIDDKDDGPCLIAQELPVLRRFRDEVLAGAETGRRYTEWYYRFSPELSKIALSNPSLGLEAAAALGKFLPSVQSMLDGDGA